MRNTPIPEAIPEVLCVPFPAQPTSPSLFPKNNHHPNFRVIIFFTFLYSFITQVHLQMLKFIFAFVCVWGLGLGIGGRLCLIPRKRVLQWAMVLKLFRAVVLKIE